MWHCGHSPTITSSTKEARDIIAAPRRVIWISTVSRWEIAIQHGLGCGDTAISGKEALRFFRTAGYRLLGVELEHAIAVEDLPLHHHDPFDRLLVAQALVEPMRLTTHNTVVAGYSDTTIQV